MLKDQGLISLYIIYKLAANRMMTNEGQDGSYKEGQMGVFV